MQGLPQMWEVSARVRARELADSAQELAESVAAESSGVTWGQRCRGATGQDAWVTCSDGHTVAGRLELASDDGLLLSQGAQRWLVPMPVLVALQGPQLPAALPARGLQRRPIRGELRCAVGESVAVGLSVRVRATGVLTAVGADHIVLSATQGTRLVTWHAISWVGWRPVPPPS